MTSQPDKALIDELRAAADRLITGNPLRSSGKLTILDLASEAGVKRWILTHKHPELRQQYQAEFKNHGRISVPVQAAQARITELEESLAKVHADKRRLKVLVDTYAIIINQLTDDLAEAERQRDEALVHLDRQQPRVKVLANRRGRNNGLDSTDL